MMNCTYNPISEAQKLRIGTKLLEGIIEDARQRKAYLGNKSSNFILAKSFNTSEFLLLSEFYVNIDLCRHLKRKENPAFLSRRWLRTSHINRKI